MTAPIDIECPRCKAIAGLYCTTQRWNEKDRRMSIVLVDYHHAERVDAWARVSSATHLPPDVDVGSKEASCEARSNPRTGIVGRMVEICGNRCRVLAVHFDPRSRSWEALCEREDGSLESVTLNYAQVVKP